MVKKKQKKNFITDSLLESDTEYLMNVIIKPANMMSYLFLTHKHHGCLSIRGQL